MTGEFPELCCSKPCRHPSGAEPRDLWLDRKQEGLRGSSEGCRRHPHPTLGLTYGVSCSRLQKPFSQGCRNLITV